MKDVKNRRMTLMAQIWLVNPCGPVKMSTVFTAENSEGHLEFNICLEVYTNIKAHSFLTFLPHSHMKNRDKSQLVDFMTSYVFLEYMNINCYFMYHKTQRKNHNNQYPCTEIIQDTVYSLLKKTHQQRILQCMYRVYWVKV